MLKALGISKKQKAATESQVHKHSEQQASRDQWRIDAQAMMGIISKLGQTYGAHKGDFALGRYEELKGMIKDSISEYNVLLAQTKARTLGKYGDKAKAYGAQGGAKTAPQSGAKQRSALQSLKENAHAMAMHQDSPRDAADMSAKDVEEDLTRFRREILQYKQDFKDARDKLDKLTTEYEESKKLSPPQRYNELKNMIKNITRSSQVPSGGQNSAVSSAVK